MDFIISAGAEAWRLLQQSAVYVIFGIVIGGLLKAFLPPDFVYRHLGVGRFKPVLKAALLGIPLPLCSCGVLPAAASLKRQGANVGATTSFLISTPESGIDSLAISYALLDPVMTIARPAAGFAAAAAAGLSENLLGDGAGQQTEPPDLSCPIDGCCDGIDCPPGVHRHHHTALEKIRAGLKFAFGEMWGDLAAWFMVGLILAGAITALVPEEVMARFLGGGLSSMLLMLVIGIPIYICATSSTPIAAALILSGVSPGAALVFLLAGPATNVTSLTVLIGLIGKRGTAIYLAAIALTAVAAGLVVDWLYGWLGVSPRAAIGQAAELVPGWLALTAAIVLLALSIKPVWRSLKARFTGSGHDHHHHGDISAAKTAATGCGCSGST